MQTGSTQTAIQAVAYSKLHLLRVAITVASLGLCGCTVGPDSVWPQANVNPSWLMKGAMKESDVDYWRDSMRSESGEELESAWYRSFRKLLLGVFAAVPLLAWAAEQDVATGSVAAAIREAGYSCAHVVDMERFTEGVSQGLTVWKVRCNSGQFKVIFKGDTGSEVVPLD